MTKKKKIACIAGVCIAIISIVIIILFFLIPKKLMEFRSDDGSIKVTISEYRELGPFANAVGDYNITIKKKGSAFDKTLLDEDFTFSSFKLGHFDEDYVNIQWYSDHVVVTIDTTKGHKKSYVAYY